ncbi:siderophore-interacting protein [Naumannella halotolerans]|uniref:NADPH-dependent ferric siderophore reductase n=1 Tax=Naumannella halotolerans TaxID=993414 RepID=A0A4R7JAX9_9ACTN|nr:siderophore-interacting protein [Naumannella halotolerans]TDT34555.1 NADPH-dependent ferric siderophore reductase [Naumannella halotolerans]
MSATEQPVRQRRKRQGRTVEVVANERITPEMARLTFTAPELAEFPELEFTDHYVKLLFPPPGADYAVAETLQHTEDEDLDQRPVTRTYTIRSFDRGARQLVMDFVVHGTEGIAGPWAAAAQPGEKITFYGPGGGFAPSDELPDLLLAGDESALPAIAAAVEALPPGVRAHTFVEVNTAAEELPLPGVEVTWLHRKDLGTPPGVALAQAVRAADLPEQFTAFVHGNAEMIRDLRMYLFVERGLDRKKVSISGYWRTGMTEDLWQSTKREFVESMDAAEGVGA